jgi:hypothetical protein
MNFVEDILWDFVTTKVNELVSHPELLDVIFESRSKERREQVKQWMTTSKIRTTIHYPRDASELPCFVIVCQSQSEAEQVIGSSGDTYDEVYISDMGDGWISSDSYTMCSHPMSTAPLPPPTLRQFYSRIVTKDGRQSCHIQGDKGACKDHGIFINYTNTVLEKPDLSNMDEVAFWAKSNRTGQFLEFGMGTNSHREHTFVFDITTVGLWEKITIDIKGVPNNQKRAINYMSFVVTDDSGPVDVYLTNLKAQLSSGSVYEEAFFDNVFRVECWSNNANITHDMYDILLWDFLKYRTYLETTWGQLAVRYEGGDLLFQPEWFPEFVYLKALTFHSKTIEVVPRETDLESLESVDVGKVDYGAGGGSISDP